MKNRLYTLTDDFYTPNDTIENQVLDMLECGIKIIQFRSKKIDINRQIVKNLVSLCEDFNAKLIVNDNVNLAKEVAAHGVHLGKDDENLSNAINFLGKDKIYGVSCYDDINLALNLQSLGASYVAFGAIFKSTTKAEAEICDLKNLDFSKLQIPTCVIGGINSSNLDQILYKKADYLAIVSAVYKPNSIKENLTNLQTIIKANNGNI